MIAPFVGLGFGMLWLFVGASALRAPYDLVAGLVGLVLFIAVAVHVVRRREQRPQSFNRKIFVLAVIFEVVAIAIAQSWLLAHGLGVYLIPVVGILVGLHFVGLWLAWQRPSFLALAVAMVAVNIVSAALPLPLRGRLALSGFGSAAALLISVAA